MDTFVHVCTISYFANHFVNTCFDWLIHTVHSACIKPTPCIMLSCVLSIRQAQRWHQGNEHFGRPWLAGDVVGCMVDMSEHTMMFTLNGEVLLDDSGSELAFKDFEIWEGQSIKRFYPCIDDLELNELTQWWSQVLRTLRSWVWYPGRMHSLKCVRHCKFLWEQCLLNEYMQICFKVFDCSWCCQLLIKSLDFLLMTTNSNIMQNPIEAYTFKWTREMNTPPRWGVVV